MSLKPIRGIISGVFIDPFTNRAYATLESPDLCEGEVLRNPLTRGEGIHTSAVQSIDVVEGQLVLSTTYSRYIVEGAVQFDTATTIPKSQTL